MKSVKHGPELVPVSREGKIKEWSRVIQTMLRDREDGDVISLLAANGYAERFWSVLEASQMPLADIMAMASTCAASWTLATYGKDLIAAAALVVAEPKTREKPHEENK